MFIQLNAVWNAQLFLISIRFVIPIFVRLAIPILDKFSMITRDPILDQFSMITRPYNRVNGLKTIPPSSGTYPYSQYMGRLPPRDTYLGNP